MKTLISQYSISFSNPHFSPPAFLFNFPSLVPGHRSFRHISGAKWPCNPETSRLSSVRANWSSEKATYGGWEDLRPAGGDGESNQLRDFLAYVGIDDRKHVLVFLLGVVCAFSISRVKVSSIIVLPASVLVFAIGFSVGFVRSGGGVGANVNKRRVKEDNLVVSTEKLRSLVEVFDGFSVRVNSLKDDIQKAISSRQITVSDLEDYVEAMDSISLLGSNGRDLVEESIENLGRSNVVLGENQKLGKRKKESGEIGYELWQYMQGLFKEKLADTKASRLKSNAKKETVEKVVVDQSRGSGSIPKRAVNNVKEVVSGSAVDDSVGVADSGYSQNSSSRFGLKEYGNGRINFVQENENTSSEEVNWGVDRSTESKELDYQTNRLQFRSNGHFSSSMGKNNYNELRESNDNLVDFVDYCVRTKHVESKDSFVQEQILEESDGNCRSNLISENSENEAYSRIREERVNHKNNSCLDDQLSEQENELPSLSSSSISDDVVFDRHLTEANDLLKQAKGLINVRDNEEHAEIILYRSAKLLSKAITMKPMSLLAVGLLGNTYLLHGELKLRISRELRMQLRRSDPSSVEKWIRMQDKINSKDDIASVLINVCEECEELLVEAGRKYRLALSIDGNDVRALYNWGLALSFRAQLIADIGPGAAFDADELFLAAIDKFDAMMSRGNVYAPDALFRWGVTLQQRSHLRPRNGKEKMKLLQQAKRLYEDALNMDSNNVQVRQALSSCMSELSSRDL